MSSRHIARSIVLQSLYEIDFRKNKEEKTVKILEKNTAEFGEGIDEMDFMQRLLRGVLEHRFNIDKIIEKSAPEWPLEQITIVDRNVLRMGI